MSQFSSATLITLVGVVLIFVYVLWVYLSTTMVASTPATQIFFQCLPGECPTVVANGEKRCPAENETATYDPAFETCNSRFLCDSNLTPYALQSDGSTDPSGSCPKETVCRCLTKSQCPIYTMSTFRISNGSIFLRDNTKTRSLFVQNPITSQGNTGIPLTTTNVDTDFCAMKAYHLDRLSPGACSFSSISTPNLNEIIGCMSKNPCMVGVMAFIPDVFESFILNPDKTDSIVTVPVGCVPGIIPPGGGNLCGLGEVPVWDKQVSILKCYSVNPI